MDVHGETSAPETFNPWSIVNLVFHHLASEGLHPVLGEAGDPGAPAAELLRALGITPAAEGSRQASEQTKHDLEKIRAAFDQGLSRKHCLMMRAHDLGFRVVMQHTRTFGAVGCSPWALPARTRARTPETPRKG
jgi:hypothetical protein